MAINRKQVGRWGGIIFSVLLVLYMGRVAMFELRLGVNQPENQTTIVIATFDHEGDRHERVVRLVEVDGNYYVAANHWPRAWYHQALDNPRVEVEMEDEFEPYTAVPVEGEEEAMMHEEYDVSLDFRFRTGFPPRYFLRLEPV